jgi:hypothetical protein
VTAATLASQLFITQVFQTMGPQDVLSTLQLLLLLLLQGCSLWVLDSQCVHVHVSPAWGRNARCHAINPEPMVSNVTPAALALMQVFLTMGPEDVLASLQGLSHTLNPITRSSGHTFPPDSVRAIAAAEPLLLLQPPGATAAALHQLQAQVQDTLLWQQLVYTVPQVGVWWALLYV